MIRLQSLRAQFLLKLALPTIMVVIFDALASYFVAMYYTDLAYDRWLLDSARSLVQEVKTHYDRVTFELPPIAVKIFRRDNWDKTFFKVESHVEGFIAGDINLPSPSIANIGIDKLFFFSDGEIDGQAVRIVSVLAKQAKDSNNVLISVAETLNKRRTMMQEILLAAVLPQILLVLVAGFHIWSGVNRVLTPLNDLARHLTRRSAKDFNPIPDAGIPLEVRSLTHTINALLQRLGSTLVTQQRFIENAAHQLRTPLAGLKIQAERALCADNAETMRLALVQIENAADRVAHLSTQLLVLARSDSVAHTSPEFKWIDLTKLVRDCCIDWVPRALERNIELGFDAPAPVTRVAGHEVLLRELLSNLLDNAIRYGKPGGHVGVKIKAVERVLLIVEDDGPGIPLDEQEKIFERFYRIQGSSEDGCGLGLSIVKEIAELHAADIKMRSGMMQGCGTRIEISFNCAKNDRPRLFAGRPIAQLKGL